MISIQQDIRLSLGERVAKSHEHPLGFRNVDTATIDKPTIFAIAALDSYSDNDANGMAKRVQMLLGRSNTYTKDVQIIGAHQLGHLNMARAIRYHNEMAAMGQYIYPPGLMEFAKKQLQPLVTEGEPPQKIDVETACRRMRNITFFTHSSGTVAVDEIGNALCDIMEKVGYTDDEIARITSQAAAVNIAGVASFGRSRSSFSTVNLVNLSDTLIPEYSDNLTIAKRLIENTQQGKDLHVLPISSAPNQYLVAVDHIPKNVIRSDHTGRVVDGHDKLHKQMNDEEGHMLTSYTHYGLDTHGFILPQILSTVLANSVNNALQNAKAKPFTPLETAELFNSPDKIRFKTSDAKDAGVYSNIIAVNEATGFTDRIRQASEEEQIHRH